MDCLQKFLKTHLKCPALVQSHIDEAKAVATECKGGRNITGPEISKTTTNKTTCTTMKARHCPPFETSSKPQSLVDEDSNNASNLLPPVEEEEDDPNLSDDDMEECQVVVDEFALKLHWAVEDGKICEPTPKRATAVISSSQKNTHVFSQTSQSGYETCANGFFLVAHVPLPKT